VTGKNRDSAAPGWVAGLPAEVLVCDIAGIALAMNREAEILFTGDGGPALIGKNVLDCHPAPDREKLAGMLAAPRPNAYFSTEKGVKRFFFQAPWQQDGCYAGFVELSFEVPDELPHFVRG
jgi:hypothetical protein